ncbi:MAG: Rrf2 family transcriptional regulator [Campylobacterales bacterium]
MATISTRGSYGVAAMAELARYWGSGVVQIGRIAHALDLSQNYMEQIFGALRKAGLVESVRGAQGGYRLSREPAAITVLEILEVLEGGLCEVVEPKGSDGVMLFWKERHDAIRAQFEVTLEELLAYDAKAKETMIYYI